ncbi:MAG: Cation diffusion facilitator family transporter [uncultured bacterium]|nr:MAG: Cation diffusion facilitator family transporter [uncultured bacterium]
MTHHHNHTNHMHDHHHVKSQQSFNFAFGVAVVLNFSFTVFQVVYAMLAGSMSLLADAVHNFGDVFGLVLAWGANWLLTLPARERYSYGFKRTTIIAALSNALILVATSSLIAYESIQKLLHITAVNGYLVIVVALIGIIINGSTALLFMNGAHDDLNIKGAFLHLLADALISFGVVIAGVLILLTHRMWVDPLAGLIIVALILWGTWGLLRDSIRLLLDAVPHYIDVNSIQHYLQTLPGVVAVHDLHIWGLSTKEVALTVHLIMPTSKLTDENFKTINVILKQTFRIDHATIQVEAGSPEFPCEQIKTC